MTALKPQNTSHAVMAQRHEAKDSRDDFPTPPWATRALIEHVIGPENIARAACLEPACGNGHMAKVLNEYFANMTCSDIHPYGYGEVRDFLNDTSAFDVVDWVITNPPFRLAEEFFLKAMAHSRKGVALLTRTTFIESVGRFNRIFNVTPPSKVAQFVERVPMVKGRLDAKASTATSYAWIIWEKGVAEHSRMVWIPPCRKSLERPFDYEEPNIFQLDAASAITQPVQETLL